MRKRFHKNKAAIVYDVAAILTIGGFAALILATGPLAEKWEQFYTEAFEERKQEQASPPGGTFPSGQSRMQRVAGSSEPEMQYAGQWGRFTFAVAADGPTVYFDDGEGLRALDVSNPEAPVQKGHAEASLASDITLAGSYAYVVNNGTTIAGDARSDFGLRVIDITAPTNPRMVGALNTSGSSTSVAVAGNYAYVAEGVVRVIDVSDPTRSQEIGTFSRGVREVAVKGEHAYLVGESGLQVFDVSAPSAPRKVSTLNVDDFASDLAVAGGYAYVAVADRERSGDADGVNHGLRVVDISDPTAPRVMSAFDTPERISEVAASGKRVYITYAIRRGEPERLQMIDATSPAKLRPEGTLVLNSPHDEDVVGSEIAVMDLVATEGYVYVAGWHGGMVRVKVPSE